MPAREISLGFSLLKFPWEDHTETLGGPDLAPPDRIFDLPGIGRWFQVKGLWPTKNNWKISERTFENCMKMGLFEGKRFSITYDQVAPTSLNYPERILLLARLLSQHPSRLLLLGGSGAEV